MKKLIVTAVITYNSGKRELKEYTFDSFNSSRKLISEYIKENTPDCYNVTIIDVWVEV